MNDEIINTWQDIATHLRVNVDSVKRIARENPDFPVFRAGRIWTTKEALVIWFRNKALKGDTK